MKIKHIYWFAYFNLKDPSVRYRAKFPLLQLKEKHGITPSIVYPGYDFKNLSNFLKTFFVVLFFRKSDSIIVFEKLYTNGIYATALKILLFFRPQNTLYDTDDAEHTRHPVNTIHHFMKKCSKCAVGSQSLLDYSKQYNENVFLLTSPVIDHGIIKTAMEKTFTVGWIGYYGAHRQSLTQLFFPALYNIDFPLKLKLLGVENEIEVTEIKSYFKDNKNIIIDAPLNLDWQNEPSIYKQIKTFDIGVAPLLDNEFNRCKSAFKLKQCLSCGVPVLASSVGENNIFLQEGKNGFFCDNPADYLQKILLIKNMHLTEYSRLSINAKNSFPLFSLDNYCETFIDNFK